MASYIISYDLRKPERNYEALYEAIKAYGTWAHINESLWAVVTSQTDKGSSLLLTHFNQKPNLSPLLPPSLQQIRENRVYGSMRGS